MELKVWVEGIQRIVCGVTESTTCQDVVFALAQATGKSGRFTLLERWRSNERYLEPNEYPLKILLKLGEYSNDVQFILQWNQVKKPAQLLPLEKKMLLFSDPPLAKEKQPPKNNAQSISTDKPFKTNSTMLDIQEFFGSPVKSDHPSADTILTDLKKNHEHSSSIAPPPYRHPPPPNLSQDTNNIKCKNNNLLQEFHKNTEIVFYSYNTQYRNLIHLVNYQREKLTSQQSDITKLDAELIVWEEKCRDQNRQMEYLQEELKLVGNKIDHEQLHALNKVGEENELVKQQHKTLKSEITLLRSKISNCETELLQAKQKIRLLMDELQKAHMLQIQRSQSQKHLDEIVLADLDHLQEQIIFAKENTELNHFTAETLKREVATLKSSMFAKRKQVEDLVTELKEANLQSLSIKQSDEVKLLLEGPTKTCSTRKIIGSPRQLENAVPTNKNPHGVWV